MKVAIIQLANNEVFNKYMISHFKNIFKHRKKCIKMIETIWMIKHEYFFYTVYTFLSYQNFSEMWFDSLENVIGGDGTHN